MSACVLLVNVDSSMALYQGYKGGPVGYGDPEDRNIGDTERGTLFSNFVRERLMFDLCEREWRHWRACIRAHKTSWIPSRKCRMELALVNECQNTLVQDPEQIKKFEEEYLKLRAEFRRTGVGVRYFTKEMLRRTDTEPYDNR